LSPLNAPPVATFRGPAGARTGDPDHGLRVERLSPLNAPPVATFRGPAGAGTRDPDHGLRVERLWPLKASPVATFRGSAAAGRGDPDHGLCVERLSPLNAPTRGYIPRLRWGQDEVTSTSLPRNHPSPPGWDRHSPCRRPASRA